MFMVKDEYINTKNLLRARLLATKPYTTWCVLVVAIFAIGIIGSTAIGILQHSQGMQYRQATDFSVSVFVGLLIGYVIGMFIYRSTNKKLAVYPQTNNSRFLSSLISNYVAIVGVAVVLLMIYLMHFGTVRLMSVFIDGIHFAFNFSLGFVFAGFFVFLSYSFLIVATIELFGVILRKWRHYAVIVFTVILSVMIGNWNGIADHMQNTLAFIIGESSLVMFFLKAAGLWFILTVLAIVINKYTVYNKSHSRLILKWVIATCIGVVIIVQLLFTFVFPTQHPTVTESFDAWDWVDDFGPEEIRIDISHLSAGSIINISASENIIFSEMGGHWVSPMAGEINAYLSYPLDNIQGDTLIVNFQLPRYALNGIELYDFSDAQVTTHLEDDTLFINYYIESTYVIIMPIWSFARQFSIFQDRGLFFDSAFGTSRAVWGAGIQIWVE